MTLRFCRPVGLVCLVMFLTTGLLFSDDTPEEPKASKGEAFSNYTAYKDVRYGTHKRNTLDIWVPNSDKPTPLVIYIHGGGFVAGDKSKLRRFILMVRSLLAKDVAVASINYRYMTGEPNGVRASLYDSRRALQYLRYTAKKWNIDKTRIAAFGTSAGAGTSLWLAVHPEMADPKAKDPVLRESTRLSAAGALATQATYDLTRWPAILQIAPSPADYFAAAYFVGFQNAKQAGTAEGKAVLHELDMLGLMSKDDAPIFICNSMGTGKKTRNERVHHPLHAVSLAKRAEEVGLEHQVYAPKMKFTSPKNAPPFKMQILEAFLLKYLKASKPSVATQPAPTAQKKE